MAVSKKKRLPIVSSGPGDTEPPPDRPGWHWVGFGTVILLAIFLPLTYIASIVIRQFTSRLGDSEESIAQAIAAMSRADYARYTLLTAGPHVLALVLASWGAGFVMGRWGATGVGPRHAVAASAIVTLVLAVLTFGRVPLLSHLVILAFSAPACAWGARRGSRPGARSR